MAGHSPQSAGHDRPDLHALRHKLHHGSHPRRRSACNDTGSRDLPKPAFRFRSRPRCRSYACPACTHAFRFTRPSPHWTPFGRRFYAGPKRETLCKAFSKRTPFQHRGHCNGLSLCRLAGHRYHHIGPCCRSCPTVKRTHCVACDQHQLSAWVLCRTPLGHSLALACDRTRSNKKSAACYTV